MAEHIEPLITIGIAVVHNLTDEQSASVHTGHCAVCRGDDLEVFVGKSGEGICVNAGACFMRYIKLPDEVVADD